jgi:hypothetical protein
MLGSSVTPPASGGLAQRYLPGATMSHCEFERALFAIDPSRADFVLVVDDLLAAAQPEAYERMIPAIFRYFERHPLEDMGAPGALVHFVERFYPAYKPLLFASVKTHPSYNSVLMINRILNSCLTDAERREYLSALEIIATSSSAPTEIVTEAQSFIAYQSGRGS